MKKKSTKYKVLSLLCLFFTLPTTIHAQQSQNDTIHTACTIVLQSIPLCNTVVANGGNLTVTGFSPVTLGYGFEVMIGGELNVFSFNSNSTQISFYYDESGNRTLRKPEQNDQ